MPKVFFVNKYKVQKIRSFFFPVIYFISEIYSILNDKFSGIISRVNLLTYLDGEIMVKKEKCNIVMFGW